MLVVADSKIALAREAFADLGEVRTVATPEISPASVADAEILLVRSETRVDGSLLEGSRVRFVGTATIGTDHVDLEWLRRAGVGFAAAPASNADSVKEYVVAALLALANRRGFELAGKILGVVGVGNIGGRVAGTADALGMKTLLNDPPKARQSGDSRFLPLDGLMDADIVTIHVPLQGGLDNTVHLFDRGRMLRMKPGAFLVNTSRGPVVDNQALKDLLRSGHLGGAVLDVWEGEPGIDVELLSAADIGTSHIAGYSLDGKVRATRMLREAAGSYFNRPGIRDGFGQLPPPATVEIRVDDFVADASHSEAAVFHAIVRLCYDVASDDARLRELLSLPRDQRPAHFRDLRKRYPVRREFSASRVVASRRFRDLAARLGRIGFSVG